MMPLMRLVVIAIGRLKQGPERELAERYRERFDDIGRKLGFRGLEIHEIPESRARDAATRIAEEAAAISAAIPAKSVAGGARRARRQYRQRAPLPGISAAGATTRSPILFSQSAARTDFRPICGAWHKLRMAFGSATWPHQMVRVMLLEQIYRAATILAGHPYHRA